MGKRVLIIDPSSAAAETMLLRLQIGGYEVAIEREGVAGLEMVHRFCPNLVYIDADLEKINGYQICQIIKESKEGSETRIAMMGWDGSLQARFWAQEAGADAFLSKPYSPQELLEMTKELAGK